MLFNKLIKFLSSTFYIRFSANFLSVRYIEKQKSVEYPPDVLMDLKKGKVIAIGPDVERKRYAYRGNASVVNGFKHPRVVIKDFDVSTSTIAAYMKKARRGHHPLFTPIIIMHPLEYFEGGLSQIEIKTCQDMAFAVGAREYYLWVGRKLTDTEASAKRFPIYEGKLMAAKRTTNFLFERLI